MCTGKPGKNIHFPGFGNVLEFYKIRKCPGNFLMPVEEHFDYRRKRVLVHSLYIPCQLKIK